MGSAASVANNEAAVDDDGQRRLTRTEASALAGDRWDASLWPIGAESITVAELRAIGDAVISAGIKAADEIHAPTAEEPTATAARRRSSLELARAAEARLLPPPPEVQLWLDGAHPYVSNDACKSQIRAAVPWLKEALAEAWRSAAIKAKAKALLRVQMFTQNLDFAGAFGELQAHCGEAARAVGAELDAYCERARLRATLGSVALDEHPGFEGARRRLDDAELVGLPVPPRLEHELDGEWERVVAHAVRLVALGVDGAFQALCARVAAAHGGSHRPTPIKGHARVMAKAASDHRTEPLPRPALNIDVVRCACTFETPAQLEAAARALCAELGGAAARVKNGFAPEVDGAASYHYRTLMLNWIFAPGQTYAELTTGAASAWDRYAEAPPDPTEPWGRWRAHAARALAWLRSAEVAARPVRFVCETQLLLAPYLEGRLKMHLLYKVARAADAPKLHAEFAAGDKGRWAAGAAYAGEQRAARERALAEVDEEGADAGEVLWRCAGDGELEAVRALLERGADVDWASPDDGRTPLWRAAFIGHADCVCALLERGADVDKARTSDGITPLFIAAQNGHADCVRALLERGADVDKAMTDVGATPLYAAAQNGDADCVRALLERGADVDKAKTGDGAAPLLMAAQNGHADCVRALLERGADVDKAKTDTGSTPLLVAAQDGHADCVRALLERGADVDKARADCGATPLFMAANFGHADCVRALLERGADTERAMTVNGCATPLLIASFGGYLEVVRHLLASGADVRATLASELRFGGAAIAAGSSSLQVAEEQGHDAVARALEQACAVPRACMRLRVVK